MKSTLIDRMAVAHEAKDCGFSDECGFLKINYTAAILLGDGAALWHNYSRGGAMYLLVVVRSQNDNTSARLHIS